MEAVEVLKRPILTEKSARLMEQENKYVFEVHYMARKAFIKQAIRTIYGVTVESINIAKSTPKKKKSWSGKRTGYEKPSFKKAIIKIKAGETIKVFEGGNND